MKREHLLAAGVFLLWISYQPVISGQSSDDLELKARAAFQEGERFYELQQFESAVLSFQKAIILKPDFANAYNELGMTYAALGRHQKSVEYLQAAIRLKPQFAVAHNNLGCEYFEMGKLDLAIKAFQQALAQKPDYALALN